MSGRFPRTQTLLCVAVLAFVCSSCAGTASTARALPPVALAVAVEVEYPDLHDGAELSVDQESAIVSRIKGRELEARLLDALRDLRVSSDVTLASDRDNQGCDMVLRVSLARPIVFSHEGLAASWWLSGILWYGTLVGGLAICDSEYSSNLTAECSLHEPGPGHLRKSAFDFKVTPGPHVTSFLHRNRLLSWPTAQTLLLPPFLTSDDTETTAAALTNTAIDELALGIAMKLKSEVERELKLRSLCSIQRIVPENGCSVASSRATVSLEVVSGDGRIRSVDWTCGKSQGSGVVRLLDQAEPGTSQAAVELLLEDLAVGDNLVRLEIGLGPARTCKRTILINRS